MDIGTRVTVRTFVMKGRLLVRGPNVVATVVGHYCDARFPDGTCRTVRYDDGREGAVTPRDIVDTSTITHTGPVL